jgi:hypothetical protein
MPTLKQILVASLESVKNDFISDIRALSQESLNVSPGGSARAPYDYIYELVVANDRAANALNSIKNGPWPFENWAVAPSDFRTIETASSEMARSMDGILLALQSMGDDDKSFLISDATSTPPVQIAFKCVEHMRYHDAQLNYVQALSGDDKVHWE